ncbi:MAG: hypothetical protein NVSMB62_27890 [Acidobacteriaceae bacterium]
MNRLTTLLAVVLLVSAPLAAETCTTQSALAGADRNRLADAARAIAQAVQTNDVASLRTLATGDLQKNFGGLQYLVAVTSPRLSGGAPQVEQLYLLDASTLKPAADGTSPEAQFFCTLANSSSQTQFSIAGLTPGRYAFAMVAVPARPIPWRLSMLLRQEGAGPQAKWLLAGIYPKPLTLAGHDGLWFWTQGRQFAERKQQWNAWLFFQTAQTLLRPADFVISTHLDKLHTEAAAATPPPLSDGISPATPLVLKSSAIQNTATKSPAPAAPAAAGDLHFTALSLAEPTTGSTAPLLAVHLRADPLTDPAGARQRNTDAARALVSAYPELRTPFQVIAITADSPGQPPLTTEVQTGDLR